MVTDELIQGKEHLIQRVLHIHFMTEHICSKYRVELDDLMQVGRIALWEASRKFRPKENGLSFNSYAHRIINFRLLNFLEYLRKPIRQTHYADSIYTEVKEGTEILDVIPSNFNTEERAHDQLYMESIISDLPSLEKNFFQLRLMGHTHVEIKEKLNVKETKYRIIRESTMKKIEKTRKGRQPNTSTNEITQ